MEPDEEEGQQLEFGIDTFSDPTLGLEQNDRKKRKSITFLDKLLILEQSRKGVKRGAIAMEFGLNISTVYKIIKNEDKTLSETSLPKYQEDFDKFQALYPTSMLLQQRKEPINNDIADDDSTYEPALKRRKKLSLADKLNIIRLTRFGVPRDQLLEKYGTTTSSIEKVIREQDDIIASCDSDRLNDDKVRIDSSRLHRRNSPYQRINEFCLKWYKQKELQLNPGTSIKRKTVKAKALEIAQELAINDSSYANFKGSDGWLDSFYRVNGIGRDKPKKKKVPFDEARDMVNRVVELARDAGILHPERAMDLAQLAAEFDDLHQKEENTSEEIELPCII